MHTFCDITTYIIQIYFGIAHRRVLNGELCTQRLQKLIYLCLSSDCFIKIFLHSLGQIRDDISTIFMPYIHLGRASGWLVLIISYSSGD